MYIGEGAPYVHFGAEIGNRAGVPSAVGSQFHLHPSWTAGWTLSGEDLGKFGLEKAILEYLRPFGGHFDPFGPRWTPLEPVLIHFNAC